MLLDTLKRDLVDSLKRADSVRVETLRYLLAAVHDAAIAKYANQAEAGLVDADVLEVIKKQVKTHQESIAAFTQGKRNDLVKREQAQLVVLEGYMPKQMSDSELKALLAPVVASGESNLPSGRQDFGQLMKQAMVKVAGGADGDRVAALLKGMLSK